MKFTSKNNLWSIKVFKKVLLTGYWSNNVGWLRLFNRFGVMWKYRPHYKHFEKGNFAKSIPVFNWRIGTLKN